MTTLAVNRLPSKITPTMSTSTRMAGADPIPFSVPSVAYTSSEMFNFDLNRPTTPTTGRVEEIAHNAGITHISPSVITQEELARVVEKAIENGGAVRVIVPDADDPDLDPALRGIAKVIELEVDVKEAVDALDGGDNSHKEADERRSVRKERLWIFIDTFGTIRNTVAGTSTSIKISGSVAAAAALPALTAVMGGMATVGGLAIIFSALFDNFPDVRDEIREARRTKDTEKLYLSIIGLFTSVVFYGGFGVGLTGMGVSLLFTPDVASGLFHASYGTQTAVGVATGFGDYLLGSLCIARGSLMGGRAFYNMRQLSSFNEGFYDALRTGRVGDFLREQHTAKHEGHFHRMAGNSVALQLWMREGMQGEPRAEVCRDIDKHIHRQQYISKLVMIISVLMIIGGICAICVGGGLVVYLALLPLTLTTNIAGTLMEFYYCHYDTSSWLDKGINNSYNESRGPEFERVYEDYARVIKGKKARAQLENRPVRLSLIDDDEEIMREEQIRNILLDGEAEPHNPYASPQLPQ